VAPARRSRSTPADKPGPGKDARTLRPQGLRTRAKLLDAAMTVLAEKGYHSARVDDIVKAAEVSHGTFYLYFANKQELLVALAEDCATEMTGVVAGLGEVAPGAAGRAELRTWLADFVATYRRFGVVIRAWMEDTVNDRGLVGLGEETFGVVAASLVQRVEESGQWAGRDPALNAAALLALIERFTYYLTSRAPSAGDDAMIDTLAALVHRGWFGGTAEPLVA
jgi:AcrR family transcriptional regulator